eukprot:scaffold136469_cov72-Phaeocystis_antarctica.AAC.1
MRNRVFYPLATPRLAAAPTYRPLSPPLVTARHQGAHARRCAVGGCRRRGGAPPAAAAAARGDARE